MKKNSFAAIFLSAGMLLAGCLLGYSGYILLTKAHGQSSSNAAPSMAVPYLTGTTGSIGGSLLALGGNANGTATVTGAVVGMPCIASPSDGTNIAALGMSIECTVTSANTVTVNAVSFLALTPPSKTYNVRVYP